MLVGDGAEICAERFGELVEAAPPQLVKGHAFSVCRIAEKQSAEGTIVTAAEIVPNYLKLAQAEKEKLAMYEDMLAKVSAQIEAIKTKLQ